MTIYSTREAAQALNVSPTTIKRWASHFQGRFSKDGFGHYLFGEKDMEKLSYIKAQLVNKQSLDRIVLDEDRDSPDTPEAGPAQIQPSLHSAAPAPETHKDESFAGLAKQLDLLQYRLSQKADDIVIVQLLEHRKELDELTRSVQDLSRHMDSVSKALAQLQKQPDPVPLAASFQKPAKKRRLLASLFQL